MRTRSMSRGEGAPPPELEGTTAIPEALLFVLRYVDTRALLALEAVSRQLRDAIRGDATLWQHMHVGGSLSKKLTTIKLRRLAWRAKGHMHSLSLPNCTRVSEVVVKEIVAANPRIQKLELSGCTAVTGADVLEMVRMQAARHPPGLTKLRIQGLHCVSPERLDAIQTIMQVTNAPHSPQYYSHGEHSPGVSDERPIDLEACPKCRRVATVFDCTRSTCEELRSRPCRACYWCIARCEECGACVAEEGIEETFCGEFLCETCELDLGKCSECERSGCSRHLEALGIEDDFTTFTCEGCQALACSDNEIFFY